MLLSQHACVILLVGEITEKKGFKRCFVRVRTQEKRDEVTNEIVRDSGLFDCEVAFNDPEKHKLLEMHKQDGAFVPCTFMLRSFVYQEKGQEKLGKQLQLKRWWV